MGYSKALVTILQTITMHISIAGLGWLGLPLATHLQGKGQHIVGTCRDGDKAASLLARGIAALPFRLSDRLDTNILAPLFQSQLLILNIPPGKHSANQDYQSRMQQLIAFAKAQGVEKILFISSTAVYGDTAGIVTENSATQANTASAQAHVAIEQTVIDTFGTGGGILRLAGLVGGERNPARHLAGRSALANPRQKVNLLHRDDVISAIDAIIGQDKFGAVMHLSAHDHPSRKEYYQWAARQLGLAEPGFLTDETHNTGKQIDSHWTCQQLGLSLKYPSPFDMLK